MEVGDAGVGTVAGDIFDVQRSFSYPLFPCLTWLGIFFGTGLFLSILFCIALRY